MVRTRRREDGDVVVPPRPAEGENWYREDAALRAWVRHYAPAGALREAERRLDALGRAAPGELDGWAREADRVRPVLRGEARNGGGEVAYGPAYLRLRAAAREHGVFTSAYRAFGKARAMPRPLAFALGYLYAQAESGYYCPACMTDGAAFVLGRHAPAPLRDRFVPRLVAEDGEGAFEGAMYLTERGGGSDVGGGTRTVAARAPDGSWRLSGEKWFASNCSADVALALARVPGGGEGTAGLGLFAVPRDLPDGSPNPGLRVARLKDKLGVASMATGEVVLDGAHALLVKGPPDGFRAMAEMVNLSRLYNAVASVGVARRALREGMRAGRHREAFGRPLRDHALFRQGLVAALVEVEGGLAFTLDAAAAFERWAGGEADAGALVRVLTPCAKAMTAKLAVRAASEACEWLGGVGYTEEYVTPRLLRDAQVLPIWEGTTNVQALEFRKDVRRPGFLDAFLAHARAGLPRRGSHAASAARGALDMLEAEAPRAQEASSLRLLRQAYDAHAAGLLARLGAKDARAARVADLFAALRLGPRGAGLRTLEKVAAKDALALLYD